MSNESLVMKTNISRRGCSGLTKWDVLIVVAILFVLFLLLAPTNRNPDRERRISCVNQLKEAGRAFLNWRHDHDDKYPWQVSIHDGGTMEWAMAGPAYRHFRVLSNELANPKILICPSDKERVFTTNFARLTNLNISYFVVLLPTNALREAVLMGDRNLALTNQLPAGVHAITTNMDLGFYPSQHGLTGNVYLDNDTVVQANQTRIRQLFKSGLPTNWVAVP